MISINTQPLGTLNQLKKSGSSLELAIERLSSGLRINSAKDDTAGQAISNRMSSQQSGTAQAQRNTQDGISLLQTAQGAMDEINNRLQRVRELTVRGLNGVFSQNDADAIQGEINLNLQQIDKLASSTHFNGLNLLNGKAGDINIQVGANSGDKVALDFSSPGFDIDSLGLTDLVISGISGNVNPVNQLIGSASNIFLSRPNTTMVFYPTRLDSPSSKLLQDSNNQYYIQAFDAEGSPAYYRAMVQASHDTALNHSSVAINATTTLELYPPQKQVQGIELSDATVTFSDRQGHIISADSTRLLTSTAGSILEVSDGAGNFTYYNATATATSNGTENFIEIVAGSLAQSFTEVTRLNGASTITLNPANVEVNYLDKDGKYHANVLTLDSKGQYVMNISENGVSSSKTATIVRQNDNTLMIKTINGSEEIQIYHQMRLTAATDASTNRTVITMAESGEDIRLKNPDKPLAALDDAMRLVDSKRSYLGVMTNRLESISSAQSENIVALSASRSRISDADYAIEVSVMARAEIIQQAGTAMLAQANQNAQAVLQLLQHT